METVNQESPAVEEQQAERTFTQSEVNALVQDRVGREKDKYRDYETIKAELETFKSAAETQKSEKERADALQKELDELKAANELNALKQKIAGETGVPVNLLNQTTEEALREQAALLQAWKPAASYPSVKDGGETTAPTITKEQILSIKNNKERMAAIKAHIDLF